MYQKLYYICNNKFKQTMRTLASIRKISSVFPIKGKDRVEMVTVDGWTCMVAKSENFKPGDTCIFCEPDSVFPATEEWEFLRKYNYRIKTQKFKDADGLPIYSQGLVLPVSKVKKCFVLGDDVTAELGITQYEDTRDVEVEKKFKNPLMRYEWFRKLTGRAKIVHGDFPAEISKTDEERVQNCPDRWKLSDAWIATEKVDGQSGTFLLRQKKFLFWKRYEFVVCSRNMTTDVKTSSYWQVAVKYDIENALKKMIGNNKWICLQGEILGPGIQKNKYKLIDYSFKGFNIITPEGRLSTTSASALVKQYGIPWVPIIETLSRSWFEHKTVNDILAYSNGMSQVNKDTCREGIVFRSFNGRHSFKVVSPEFLIKFDE